jgi:putative Ca2+/H+ antiporter (TMEM165/GDT1 family)
MMEASVFDEIVKSSALIFAGEMGDKTQLLSLLLVSRYGRPWVILSGVFLATLLNHFMASFVGAWATGLVSSEVQRWGLAVIFWAFAIWILFPDKEEELEAKAPHRSLFVLTTVLFFMAEMGDKTQLATVALAAKFQSYWGVTLGSTLGMMGSNALALFWGPQLLKKIPMKHFRIFASFLFVLFGILVVIESP